MNRTNPDRLPTRSEAESLALVFDRGRCTEPDPGVKVRYALARNTMMMLARGKLIQAVDEGQRVDLVKHADDLFRSLAAGEAKAKDAAKHWFAIREIAQDQDGGAR